MLAQATLVELHQKLFLGLLGGLLIIDLLDLIPLSALKLRVNMHIISGKITALSIFVDQVYADVDKLAVIACAVQ
jgi:hypothetical protein